MTDLPALDQPQAFVVVGPDDQRGPYTLELLISEVVAGRLHDATPVWWAGLGDWTTMTAHPALAAEIQRRRQPVVPQPAAPFAPQGQPEQYAPPPGAYTQAEPTYAQPEATYSQPEPSYAQPMNDPFAPSQGSDTGDVIDVAEVVDETPYANPETSTPEATTQYVSDTGVVMDVDPVDITPEDFEAVDEAGSGDGFRAAGSAMGLDPAHGEAFAQLIARSRARSEAAGVVAEVDSAFVDATLSSARTMGLEVLDRSDDDEAHRFSMRAPSGDTWDVSLGRVSGHKMAVRDSEVSLEARCRAEATAGDTTATTGALGEVLVVSEEYTGTATASVSLLLAIEDYVSEDFAVDATALERDLTAVIASVRSTLG